MFERRPGHTVAHALYPRALNLPSHPELGAADIDRVVQAVRQSITQTCHA